MFLSVRNIRLIIAALLLPVFLAGSADAAAKGKNAPVDYVNPYIGNISHLLKPTYPTVHLPYGMLRVYPARDSYTDSRVNGLPVLTVNHRECTAFNISAMQGKGKGTTLPRTVLTDYDNEVITPYYYATDIDGQSIRSEFTPSYHSAVYRFTPYKDNKCMTLLLNAQNGELTIDGATVSGYQYTWGGIKVYIYAQADVLPVSSSILVDGNVTDSKSGAGDDACAVMVYDGATPVTLCYGVSYIDAEQARRNMEAEVSGKSFDAVMAEARDIWNSELGKIEVERGTEADKEVFYTALYRCMERPVDIAEQGRYFSPADRKVHDGEHHYTDDWYWDTYRAAHPLRLLIDESREVDMINSMLDYARQSIEKWLPTFPAVSGDSHRMNCNHGIAVVADAVAKGVGGFDLAEAYAFGKAAVDDKTLAPWRNSKAGYLNRFYRDNGFIPALHPGEKEILDEVDGWEKRQAVAVTLGTSYDDWCLSRIAVRLGLDDEAAYRAARALNYRNLFNPATSFFHPKDSAGRFIEPFDYRFSGGIGARDYYDENNGWTYRWDCQHDIPGLIELMGGNDKFIYNLDDTFNEWLGCSKYEFYGKLPDQTGNVGQFTMGNEPSMHIPYLYNYAGEPWRTQRRVRQLIRQWFRPDVMGMPGDEDGGGLSSFVVFSMMGFYPVTPGTAEYAVGTPFFDKVTLKMGNGKKFVIEAPGTSDSNKYIKYATINGKPLAKPMISHDDIKNGGTVKFEMTDRHQSWNNR